LGASRGDRPSGDEHRQNGDHTTNALDHDTILPETGRTLRHLRFAILLILLVPPVAGAQVRQVLVLSSLDRGNLILDAFIGAFRVEMDTRTAESVTFTEFVVNPSGFTLTPEDAIVDYLRTAFANRRAPDLVVTTGGPAATFARKYRRKLFPSSPVLFAAVDERFLRAAPLAPDETAAAVSNDFPGAIDDILQLFPQTTNVFVVMSSGSLGRFWQPIFARDFQRFWGRVTFRYSTALSLQQILQRVSSLPPNSAILYHSFSTDAQGGAYPEEQVLREIHSVTNAPLFATQSAQMGHGIVGGRLMRIEDAVRTAVDAAVSLLEGAPPASVRPPVQRAGSPLFDWRELRRWGVSPSQLPPGSTVLFQPPSLWSQYRTEVLITLAIVVTQSVLIMGLLYQRRARRQAELESRRNLALAADASRRVTMSTMTGSIAHELSQPLSSILHNAQAAEMLVDANRATPDSMREILADIRTENVRATEIVERHRTMLRTRALDRRPIDIHSVVRESLALVAHDMRTKHVRVDVNLPDAPCLVKGDQVLLQQVLVNLLVNAMDAMAETPVDRRRLTIHSKAADGNVEMSVTDAGTGLPAQDDRQLFEPFVTTKANGLGIGLTIARTIVEAHSGRLTARNNPDGGATFCVTLPGTGHAEGPSISPA
jgi:signal transduction histidine kinase